MTVTHITTPDPGSEGVPCQEVPDTQAPPVTRESPKEHSPTWVENDAYAAMLRRMHRAYGKRIGAHGVEDLTEALAVLESLKEAIQGGVDRLREMGYSWDEIGRAAGMARQSAWERWR